MKSMKNFLEAKSVVERERQKDGFSNKNKQKNKQMFRSKKKKRKKYSITLHFDRCGVKLQNRQKDKTKRN